MPHTYKNYYVTFGATYANEAHPAGAHIHPDGWVRVIADNHNAARFLVVEKFLNRWAFLYSQEEFEQIYKKHPEGELGVICDASIPEDILKEMTTKELQTPWSRKRSLKLPPERQEHPAPEEPKPKRKRKKA